MRHRSGLRKLNITDGAHRRAMLRNMSNSLIHHERIKTTLARAKTLRRFVEPLVTLGKKPTVANRRLAFARLGDRASVVKIFDDLGVRFASRNGGYLRILKYGFRPGDNAPMALVEFVIRHEPEPKPAKPPKPTKEAAAEDGDVSADADSGDSGEEPTTSEEQAAEPTAEDGTAAGDPPTKP